MNNKAGKFRPVESRHSCIAISTAIDLLNGLGGRIAPSLVSSLKEGDYARYVAAEIKPSDYDNRDDFFVDYLAIELLSKFPNFDLGIDREAVALEKFRLSEQACIEAGNNLKSIRSGGYEVTHPVHAILHSARGKIDRLLGPFSWDDCANYFGFGPGASIGIRRCRGDSWYKFGTKEPTATEGCAGPGEALIKSFRAWSDHVTDYSSRDLSACIKRVEGNSITTVPKNAKTDRVIAIEPLLNMFFQKGLGGVIRRKLKRVGVNLDSQVLNQELAQAGSSDGLLATIDLSSASDTISLALVEDLLPSDWVTAIKLCRSPVGILPSGEKIYYRKVSSMGNGFTFELESLLFWALASSVVSYLNDKDRRLAVYGDDIIVPTGCAELLIDVLRIVGFKTNVKKTFVNGPFRESCGKHYFSGVDVTPIYIRKAVDRTEADLVLANGIRRLAHRKVGYGYGCCESFKFAWDRVVSNLPRYLQKPLVPLWIGPNQAGPDGALGGDFDEVCPRRLPHYIEGFSTKQLVRQYSCLKVGEDPAMAKILFLRRIAGNPNGSDGVRLTEIPTVRYKLKFVKLTVQRWWDGGPWIAW